MSRVRLRDLDPRGNLEITGSFGVSGSMEVNATGPVVFRTVKDGEPALLVSGALEIVRGEIENQIVSASLTIQNLGTLSDRNSNSNIDLGGFF
jgi:hypothetical protein